ncbi:MAG: hypothetical protein JWL61_200 [Gemmatimonadetes bacterium]|nr:hypothetical protein [Gemmatimonadota bacterium]
MPKSCLIAIAFTLAACASACRSGDALTAQRTVADDLRGTWAELYQIPGVSTVITLAVADTSITGMGTYTIEAGRPGTIAVTGMISAEKTVDLDLARSDGWVGHFRGSLALHDSLSGYLWFRSSLGIGDPAPVSFKRMTP